MQARPIQRKITKHNLLLVHVGELAIYQPQAQISNHRRACTQALLLYMNIHHPKEDGS